MDSLRLILLIAGVCLIAGIFVWELIKKRAATRRRAELVEHLSEEERLLVSASVLGDIDRSDPFEVAATVQGRRSGDREPARQGIDAADAVALDGYDIDEDFPGEPAEDITETRSGAAAAAGDAPAGGDPGLAFGALSARRDTPEQLDLAGLELSAPARGAAEPRERGRARTRRRGEQTARGTGGTVSGAKGAGIRRREAADNEEELHIVMTVMARSGERFSGEALRMALEHANLRHGEMNIFHRYERPEDPGTPTLFSAANVLAPGYFEPSKMDSQSSPGIAMFMRLPGPERPVDAFQQMLEAAKTVAEDLDGTLCDETRSTLTPQSINHLRERIADFRRRQMLKA